MYEQFTDRSRKVLQLANQKALQYSCTELDTKHILFGLLKEGSGVACHILGKLNVSTGLLSKEFGEEKPSNLMGKLPLMPSTKQLLTEAMEEAKKLKHNYIGTEHLLLGLTKTDVELLSRLGTTAEQVREEVLSLLAPTDEEDDKFAELLHKIMTVTEAEQALAICKEVQNLFVHKWKIEVEPTNMCS